MTSFEHQQGILHIIGDEFALEHMRGNFGKAIGQSIHVRPKEFTRGRGIDTMTTLKTSVSYIDILSLASASFTILLGEAADHQLLHDVEEVVGDEIRVGRLHERRTHVGTGLC